jgi:serine acetyltransferase
MLFARFAEDVRFYHRRRWPGRHPTALSLALMVIMSPGLGTLLTYRVTHWWVFEGGRDGRLRSAAWAISPAINALVWLTKIVCKNDILGRSQIDGGVCILDEGYITCGAASIGSGTVVGPRTTIGMRLKDGGLPMIGRNVWIGSDCIVYGSVTIGDGATLLPATVATKSVPPGAVMQGNPAKLVLRNFENRQLRERPTLDAAEALSAVRSA